MRRGKAVQQYLNDTIYEELDDDGKFTGYFLIGSAGNQRFSSIRLAKNAIKRCAIKTGNNPNADSLPTPR